MDPFKTHGAVSWTGLQTTDDKAATAFYRETFGWTLEQAQIPGMPPYTLIKVGDIPIGGITQAADGQAPGWMSYVTVTDIEACVATAAKLGGQVIQAPFEVPTVGRIAVIADPQGAILAAIQYANPA